MVNYESSCKTDEEYEKNTNINDSIFCLKVFLISTFYLRFSVLSVLSFKNLIVIGYHGKILKQTLRLPFDKKLIVCSEIKWQMGMDNV